MNESEVHPVLIAVATTIADGLPVDWESLISENPELTEDLAELRVLQGVDAARRMTGRE